MEAKDTHAIQARNNQNPCLFDIVADPSEKNNLASTQQQLLQSMWGQLKQLNQGYYRAQSPANLLGPCAPKCAGKKWGNQHGPICGVPGCGGEEEDSVTGNITV